MGIFSGSPTLRRRVQKRQYAAHTGDTKNSARSGYRCVMFGTGEWASSARESTRPSCTSSSCRSGTYWRQMGSPGDLMRSTMAGEIRNSKFSAASRSRSRSGKCSAPNLATSPSSEAMLCLRSTCCQDSMRQILEIDHQVVAGGVVAREPGRLGVAAPLVEGARGCVVGARRRLDDDQASGVRRQFLLDRLQQSGEKLTTDAGRLIVVETSSRAD